MQWENTYNWTERREMIRYYPIVQKLKSVWIVSECKRSSYDTLTKRVRQMAIKALKNPTVRKEDLGLCG